MILDDGELEIDDTALGKAILDAGYESPEEAQDENLLEKVKAAVDIWF